MSEILTEAEHRARFDGFGFSAALIHLKDGGRVARTGWNGKGMWLRLVYAHSNKPDYWDLCYNVGAGKLEDSTETLTLLPWIGMKTADGGFVPWLASQTDLLAEDWQVVDG